MKDQKIIQNYINNFRRYISAYLKPNIGIKSFVYPCLQEGAIIEFLLSEGASSTDEYKRDFSKISEALGQIQQNAFGGNLEGFHFSGTNYIMEPNRFLLIKDDSTAQWDDKQAQKDVTRIVSIPRK
jgi:hypothetical protein